MGTYDRDGHLVFAGVGKDGTYVADCTCGWEKHCESLHVAMTWAALHLEEGERDG